MTFRDEYDLVNIFKTIHKPMCLFTKILFCLVNDQAERQHIFHFVMDIIDVCDYETHLYNQIFNLLFDQDQYSVMHFQTVTLFEFTDDEFQQLKNIVSNQQVLDLIPIHFIKPVVDSFASKDYDNYSLMMKQKRIAPFHFESPETKSEKESKSKLFITCFCSNNSSTKTIHNNTMIWETQYGFAGKQCSDGKMDEIVFDNIPLKTHTMELSSAYLLSSHNDEIMLWQKDNLHFNSVDLFSTFHSSPIKVIRSSPISTSFSCTNLEYLYLFDIHQKLPLRMITTYQSPIHDLHWYNSTTLLSVSAKEGVIWDTRSSKMVKSITTQQKCITASIWNPVTNTVTMSDHDGLCTVWDMRSEKTLHCEKYFSHPVIHLNFDMVSGQTGIVTLNDIGVIRDNQLVYSQNYSFTSPIESYFENSHWRIFS